MGFFSNINRLWSGADFWQGDENRRQREQFAQQDREEDERKRQLKVNQAFQAPKPGTVFQPTQNQTPNVSFDPSQPLERFNPIANTGFNNPILEMPKQTPQEAESVRKARETRETLDRLTEANMEDARKKATQGEGFFGRNFLNRKAIEERAIQSARSSAARQYQDKYGWNKDPTVLEFLGETSERGRVESERLRKDSEKLEKFDDFITDVGEVASYVPVTGSVINLGLAGSEKLNRAVGNDAMADDIESKRLELDAGMTKEEFDQLAPQASEEEFEEISAGVNGMTDEEFNQFRADIQAYVRAETGEDVDVDFTRQEFLDSFNMDTQQKIRNMQTLGLVLSPLDFLGAAGLARSGVTAAGKAAWKSALKTGSRTYAAKQAAGAATKTALREAAVPFAAGTGLSVGAQTYLGGLENVNPLDALKTGGLVAGSSLLFPSSTTLRKGVPDSIDDVARVTDDVARNADTVDDAARSALLNADEEVEAGVKKTLSAVDEGDDLPGTRRVETDDGTPAIEVEPGVKSTNAAKIPDPTSPIALARADDFSLSTGDAPIANFDSAPIEPGQLARGVSDDAVPASELTQIPEQTQLELGQVESAVPEQILRGRGDVDALGNPVLKSDQQVARELAEQGVALERGDSTAGAIEGAMENAAREAEARQVTQTPEVQLLQAIEDAQRAFDDVENVRSGERAARAGAGTGAYESAGGGEAGYRAKISQLKGRYAESGFEPIGIDSATQNQLLDAVETSGLRDFEKITAQRGLRKIWGTDTGKPVPSELQLIRKVFGETGDKIVDQVEQAIKEAPKTWKERWVDIAGIPRTAMTTFDLSMGLRQGSGVMFTNFPQWLDANKESVKYAFSPKRFDSAMDAIKNDDAFTMITDKMGVRLPGAVGEGAELMSSKDVLEKVPLYGQGVAGSNRAYTGGLTKLRYNVAKQYIESLGGIDEVAKLSDAQLKDLGEVVNTFTGSGGKAGGITDKHITTLSSTLFAPRLWASRLNMLNPRFYQRLSPAARNQALKNMASFMGAATATLGMMKYAFGDAVDIETDPRSSDFLKLRFGNTRYDIFSGLQQNIVLAARLGTGEKKSSTTGEMVTLGDGFGDPSRFDVGVDALQNKFNPVLGLVSRYMQSGPGEDDGNILTREDKFGNEMNMGTEFAKMFTPLGATGGYETYKDTGDIEKSVAMNLPALFGVGVQTYGEIPTKEQDRYATNQSLQDQKRALEEEGVPITADKISDLAKSGDYSTALRGAEYRLAELEFDEDATETARQNARDEIRNYKFGAEHGFVPTRSNLKGIEARLERGDYGSAIAAKEFLLEEMRDDENVPQSDIKAYEQDIKRYEVFDQYNVEPEMMMAYENGTKANGGIGVTAWREMMESDDPDVVAYAQTLYTLDTALLEAGAIEDRKYYWKDGSRGGSGRGSSPRFVTDIGKLGAPSFSFNPQQLQRATFAPAQGDIPTLEPLPNYSRETKEISVKRGRQA